MSDIYETEPYFPKEDVIKIAGLVRETCLSLPFCPVSKFDKIKAKEIGLQTKNGVYVVFESDNPENHDALRRIVRIGTHNKDGRLVKRLKQHFHCKDRRSSIFRQRMYELLGSEEGVTAYMKKHMSFAVIPVETEKKRLFMEKKLIATLSWAAFWSKDFRPAANWLGGESCRQEIQRYGLWLSDGILGEPFSEKEFEDFKKLLS